MFILSRELIKNQQRAILNIIILFMGVIWLEPTNGMFSSEWIEREIDSTKGHGVISENSLIEIDTNFDSASIGPFTVGGSEIDFTVISDGQSYEYWTNFKVVNVQEETVTFRITNANDVPFLSTPGYERQLVYSCNGDDWNRITNYDYDGGVYSFVQTFPCNEAQVATFFPFSYEKMDEYVDSVESSEWVAKTILGLSEQGRDIDLLTITNTSIPDHGKKLIYIIGRQHAGETSSSFTLEGMIDFLVSSEPDAERMRDNFVWYIVPMVNPDGVSLGNSRATSEGVDPNRDWHPDNDDSVEISIVRDHVAATDGGPGIDFFIDWHSQMNDVRWENFVYTPSGNTYFSILSDWTDFDSQSASGASSCTESSCTARGYIMNNILYDPAFVFEPTPHLYTWTEISLNEQGELVAYAIDEYLRPTISLLVYPYLGEITPTSAVISWSTDSAGASEVRYSLDQSYSSVTTAINSAYDGKYWHSATVTGLTADTIYFYKIFTGNDDLTPWSEITFTTAPESTASSFTFAALGDGRPNSSSSLPSQGALDVAVEMSQHNFDLAIHSGDIVYSGGICTGSDSAWNQYIRSYFDLYRQSIGDTPFYPSVGNHELSGGSCGYQSYSDVYTLPENAPTGDEEQYYSFDWGNAHFVALDTNQNYNAGSTQYNWLVNDLQTSTQPWKFVFFHHPPYSSGNHGSDIGVQTHLVPVFETYGVDVVFNGHDHHYERTCPLLAGACTTPQDGGVVYYVTGGAGAPLYSVSGNPDWAAYRDSRYHFLEVEVNDCWMRQDAIDTDGNVFDSYEIDNCSESISGLSADNDSPTQFGGTTTLSATISAGSNVSYEWDFGDGEFGSGPSETHVYPAVDIYTASVTATNSISSELVTTTITIKERISSTIHIIPGWNLIALPIVPENDYTAQSLLDEVNFGFGASCSEVDRWLDDTWDAHIDGVSFNDFDINLGEGYFLKCLNTADWVVYGMELWEQIQVDLLAGWTLISAPYPSDEYKAQSLLDRFNTEGNYCTEVDRWLDDTWSAHIDGLGFNDFDIELDQGYFIRCTSVNTSLNNSP